MSLIGKNIKKIRGVKKLSQTAFAELFNLSRTSVGAYEEERADPKIDTLVLIAKYFGVTIDNLLTKEMTINEILHFDKFGEPFLGKSNKKKAVTLTFDSVAIIDLGDVAAYFKNRDDKEYLGLLDQFYLSTIDLSDKTVFRMNVASKVYGFGKGTLLIATKENMDGTKLVLSKEDYLLTETPQENMDDEIWSVVQVVAVSESKPQEITDRVKLLESKMDAMMRKLEE